MAQLDATKPLADYQPGDRVGIFTLISQPATEALLGDSDKHLNLVVSVRPAHRVIAQAMVRAMGKAA